MTTLLTIRQTTATIDSDDDTREKGEVMICSRVSGERKKKKYKMQNKQTKS